jgi:hypothetical protein
LKCRTFAGGFYTNGKAYDSERSNALPLVRVICPWMIAANMRLSSGVLQLYPVVTLPHLHTPANPPGAPGAVDPRHIRLEVPTGPVLVSPLVLLLQRHPSGCAPLSFDVNGWWADGVRLTGRRMRRDKLFFELVPCREKVGWWTHGALQWAFAGTAAHDKGRPLEQATGHMARCEEQAKDHNLGGHSPPFHAQTTSQHGAATVGNSSLLLNPVMMTQGSGVTRRDSEGRHRDL